MTVEGRVAIGLDEFMLRLGHLAVVVELASEVGGSRHRLQRALAEWLTEERTVGSDLEAIGSYLVGKRLARVRHASGKESDAQPRARYADYLVSLGPSGELVDIASTTNEPIVVWQEDVLLADPQLPSKVGAVTVETRDITNKSGVSHLLDWCLAFGILASNLDLTPEGHLLHLIRQEETSLLKGATNPYAIRGQRLAFTWVLFQTDGDLLRALLLGMSDGGAVGKADALALFERAFQGIYEEAYGPHSTADAAAVRRVRELRDDLAIPTRSGELGRGRASTLWHRASSRFESLVDLGFLEKYDDKGKPRPYEYIFRISPSGVTAAHGLGKAPSIEDWLLAESASSVAASLGATKASPDPGRHLLRAAQLLRGPTSVHIDSCAVLASSLAIMNNEVTGIGAFREMLIQMALKHPDIGRLARGYSGSRPEHISIDWRVAEKEGLRVFQQ